VDYYVPQPISLAPGHNLFEELAHRPEDVAAVAEELEALYADPGRLALPDPSYARRFVEAISTHDSGHVEGCFGGARLFFIQPDAPLWDGPPDRRLAAPPPERRRTIRGADAATLFTAKPACTDCDLFSRDCVNMWPLMDLPRMLNGEAPR